MNVPAAGVFCMRLFIEPIDDVGAGGNSVSVRVLAVFVPFNDSVSS
jgi:hypothetical protein